MKGKSPTAEEKKWLNDICEVGCIVCKLEMGIFSPASPHHMDGRTKPGAHLLTIPLCGQHHQVPDPTSQNRWTARHENKFRFEKRYGSEGFLLEKTKEMVALQ